MTSTYCLLITRSSNLQLYRGSSIACSRLFPTFAGNRVIPFISLQSNELHGMSRDVY